MDHYKLNIGKYYRLFFLYNIEIYDINYYICLAFKVISKYKFYDNLELLVIFTYLYKNLLIDFVIELPILAN